MWPMPNLTAIPYGFKLCLNATQMHNFKTNLPFACHLPSFSQHLLPIRQLSPALASYPVLKPPFQGLCLGGLE